MNRSANANTVNAYYVSNIPDARGYSLPPIYASRGGFANGGNNNNAPPAGGFPNFNNGFAVSDVTRVQAGNGTSTFAHELGHFLLDNNRFAPSPSFHSTTANDLMLSAPNHPGLGVKEAADFGLREPGQSVGNIGTRSHLDQNVTPIGGANAITQTEAMYRSPFVRRVDNGFTYGDRADFDWVEDNIALERATTTGDNHAGFDFLVWEIGNIAPSAHTGHMHDAWGELVLPRFSGDHFQRCRRDLPSCCAMRGHGRRRPQETGRDEVRPSIIFWTSLGRTVSIGPLEASYACLARTDGLLAGMAEDYVARWLSPVDANFVRIAAFPLGGGSHDGNVRIDAIIATAERARTLDSRALLSHRRHVLAGLCGAQSAAKAVWRVTVGKSAESSGARAW